MSKELNRILDGDNIRNVMLEGLNDGPTRYPVDVKKFDISNITDDQRDMIKKYSQQAVDWMQNYIKDHNLDHCGIVLNSKRDHTYMDITPSIVVFSNNGVNFIPSNLADEETLGTLVLNWEDIKKKVISATEHILKDMDTEKEEEDSVENRLGKFNI